MIVTTATQRINYYLTTAKARSSFKEESSIDFFKRYQDSDSVYVRFTDLPKLGLNPETHKSFETPVGICCYQLKSSLEKYGLTEQYSYSLGTYVNFPFAASKKFAHFFTYKASLRLINSDTYTEEDLIKDQSLLFKFISQTYPLTVDLPQEAFIKKVLDSIKSSDYSYLLKTCLLYTSDAADE